MRKSKSSGKKKWIDPDDAPLLTEGMVKDAEYFEGDRFIRRGRGRPKLNKPKEQINIRLDADILARLRQNGPGWQTKVNQMLRVSLGLSNDTPQPAVPTA